MYKIYYNKIIRGGDYTIADIPNAEMQTKVIEYAQSQVDSGKLSQEDFDMYFTIEED